MAHVASDRDDLLRVAADAHDEIAVRLVAAGFHEIDIGVESGVLVLTPLAGDEVADLRRIFRMPPRDAPSGLSAAFSAFTMYSACDGP